MSESMCRALRDGALVGEHAPALTIKDSIMCPFGFDAFNHVLCNLVSNILAGKSQAHGLVLIAFTESPSFYFDLLRGKGMDIASSHKWIRILDCYSDPLGWKDGLTQTFSKGIKETHCKDVRDLDNLFSAVYELGKGMVGQGKARFSIAIDSVTVLLRHTQLSCVASFINNLRSHEQVSSVFWLIQTDLHDVRTTAVFEYMSSLVASLEPMTLSGSGQRCNSGNLFILEEYSRLGKLYVRMKRRNGRVKTMCEEYVVEKAGITFIAVSSRNPIVSQSVLPKVQVQFNLQLSERERTDRENVVLPFEHQGTGKHLRIYDGRRSLSENASDLTTLPSLDDHEKIHMVTDQGKGEIHYLRDSDDELPDSDEDPDDDLDI